MIEIQIENESEKDGKNERFKIRQKSKFEGAHKAECRLIIKCIRILVKSREIQINAK